ncbi:MAG: hypothetical protein H0X70_02720 [Segetibacter sp.]|nr:hypothetical protein [Segetibacter sp.]
MSPTLKRIFFVFFKTFFWIGVIGVIFYVILSIIFYFIGPDQFMSIQNFVISNRIVYLVPVSIIVCFFATGYFKADD